MNTSGIFDSILSYFLSVLSVSIHKFFHAMQRFFDFAIFGRIAHPYEPISTWTERIARHHSHMFFQKQLFGKDFIVHAGGLDVGKRIEGAARLEGPQAESI